MGDNDINDSIDSMDLIVPGNVRHEVAKLLAELRALREWKDGLHGRIMNLPCDELAQSFGEPESNPAVIYRCGHHDARHAAAELVNEPIGATDAR